MSHFRLHKPLLVALLLAGGANAANLTGVVTDANGKPIENATAYIYTAGVRRGVSPYCPSCYLDCGKTGKSNAAGQFTIEGLDPTLIFQVLLVADGYKPTAMKKVDPAKGDVTAALEARPTLPDDPQRVIRGRILTRDETPVVGATVEVANRQLPGGVTTGYPEGIDLVVFTDEQGEFTIVAEEPILSVSLLVEGKGLARRRFSEVTAGDVKELELSAGHELTGKVVHNGEPLPGVVVGLVQTDRSIGSGFVGEITAETDRNGVYRFFNVPHKDEFVIYGKMASLAPKGLGVAAVRLTTGDDDQVTTVDDLVAESAHRLVGKVQLPENSAIPPHAKVLLSRDEAWDSQMADLGADGSFRFEGLPTEAYSVTVQIPGHRASAKNKSLDVLNRFNLKGLVDADKDDLVILFEEGKLERPNYNAPEEERQAMFDAFKALPTTPLRGVE